MAGANDNGSNELLQTFARMDKKTSSVGFLDVRHGYLPGEQILLTYTVINDTYTIVPQDYIALYKCGTKKSSNLNPYRWPVSTVPYGRLHKTKFSLPNPDRRLKTNDYQFIYVSHEHQQVVGRSACFKISDIVELDSVLFDDLDTSNVVDRELFDRPLLKVTNPLPVKLYDVNGPTVSMAPPSKAQVANTDDLSAELRNALNSEVSSENIQRVAELIKQYEQAYSISQSAKIHQPLRRSDIFKPSVQVQVGKAVQHQQVDKVSSRETKVKQIVDIEDADVQFLKRFVFPYISGVLEQLTNDGFSKIICKNNQIVVLSNEKGEILDLRHGWSSYKSGEVRKLRQSAGVDVDELSEKCTKLEREMEALKLTCNNRHLQYMKELGKVRKQINEQSEWKTVDESDTIEELRKANTALLARIEVLQQKLADKTEEYEMLSKLFVSRACCLQHNDSVELLRKSTPNWKRTKRLAKKMATNTDAVDTKEESAGPELTTCNKNTTTAPLAARAPVAQKATSYAAARSYDDDDTTVVKDNKKQTATSDRALSTSLTDDQQSFLRLLHKLLNSEQADKQIEAPPIPDSESTDSLAIAMRKLFDICSSTSLASTNASFHSAKSDESILEAIKSLFASDSSTRNLVKTNSYPATPCNSADNVVRHKLTDDVKQSTSMKEVLKKLLNVSENQKKDTTPCKSDSSLWSLGEAMLKAFTEDLSNTGLRDKPNFSTSNESLAQAMHWLFDTLSQHHLPKQSSSDLHQPADSDSSSSSLGSLLLWGLTDPTPKEYENVDVKSMNQEKQRQKKHERQSSAAAEVQCECNKTFQAGKEKKNPSVSSVIRASSPDRDVDISFPSTSSQQSSALSTQTPTPQTNKDNFVEPMPTQFTFTADTSLFTLVPDASQPATDQTTLEESIRKAHLRMSRPRRVSGKTKYTCPHCGIIIQARTVSQTEYRMNRHIRLHHKREEKPWYM